MSERFTDEAGEALGQSQSFARMIKDDAHVGTQHLLLSLMVQPDTIVGLALADVGVTWNDLRWGVFDQVWRVGITPTAPAGSDDREMHLSYAFGLYQFGPQMWRVRVNSQREADALGHDRAGLGHLLLALLREPESMACQILADQVGELSKLRGAVLRRLGTEPPAEDLPSRWHNAVTSARLFGSAATHHRGSDMANHRAPLPAAWTEPAQWLADRRTLPGESHWVTNMVGSGFEAYARLLSPLDDHPGSQTWAAIARANGRTMHPSVSWREIITAVRMCPGSPSRNLPTWALEALCAILAQHTETPHTCYFAVHEHSRALHPGSFRRGAHGAGPAPIEWQLDESAPIFSYPVPDGGGRNHDIKFYLYTGRVGDAARIGMWVDERQFYPQTPDVFWPNDHAWHAATGYDSTIIGGSHQLINELCASETLEILQIPPAAPPVKST